MRRTQIYLEPGLSAELDRLARARRTSRADLIRTAARRLVAEEGRWSGEQDPIWGIVDLGRGIDLPPSDGRGSADHDRILADIQLREMAEFRKRRR